MPWSDVCRLRCPGEMVRADLRLKCLLAANDGLLGAEVRILTAAIGRRSSVELRYSLAVKRNNAGPAHLGAKKTCGAWGALPGLKRKGPSHVVCPRRLEPIEILALLHNHCINYPGPLSRIHPLTSFHSSWQSSSSHSQRRIHPHMKLSLPRRCLT